MPEVFLIADEVLADVLDAPGDRRSVDAVLNRSVPDPFDNYWDELRYLEGEG